jgi:DNA-binding SARP family transcriptional activator/WD40 repeat protein
VRFRVLGPLEVRVDARGVSPGGPGQRLLLAALLARANSVVAADTLIDVVWPDDVLADDAASRLAKLVYRLRAALGSVGASDRLITRSPGYVLSVADGELDADQFAAMLSEGRADVPGDPARALAGLDAALGLWRGPPWADVADHGFIQPEVARLEGLRAVAVEERGEALLALGRYDELAAESETIMRQYPLRERPRAQLMLALYRGGRQAEAAAVYRTFRRYLLDEMGLEPSPSLRKLEEDILQQRAPMHGRADLAGTAGPARGRQLDLASSAGERFVGRRRDLDWLEVLLDRAAGGQPAVLAVVTGAPGTGKSRLVAEFGRRVQARGGEVVFARCDTDLSATEAVRAAIAAPVDGDLQGRRAEVEAALTGFAADTAVLLVLDGLDAERDDARGLLGWLASVQPRARLLIVCTCRGPGEDLVDNGRVEVRTLAGLDRADVAVLLTSLSGAARSAELVESVFAETGGLPAQVVDVARRLRDLDGAARANRALARAEAMRESWAAIRADVAQGVFARGQRSVVGPSEVGTAPGGDVCPYKGLAAFGVGDAVFFAGRERLVAELVARLAVDRFVGVVGPSGSGKSSLVAAGLFPALAAGVLPGSERWPRCLVRPGALPMHALAAAFAPLVGEPISDVEARLKRDPGELDQMVRVALDGHETGERLVLAVDQFEEVFTACADPVEQGTFIDTLVRSPDRLAMTVVLRADYYAACADYPELARLLGQHQILVSAMTDLELRRAVLEPAWRAGLTVEDGLAGRVVEDAAGAPGALPLVSTALLETWVRRSQRTMTLAGYAEAGGVRGAVGRLAEGVYDGLDADGKAVSRRIFLCLAEPEGEWADVRRRARRDEVAGTEQAVLAELIDRRLLTATEDTVEVAHEALLREWPRLRGWLEEDREGRKLHRHLADAAMAWQAGERDEGDLYRGVRLHAARDWAASHPGDANQLETEFLTASEAAQERTLQTARSTARRLRALAVGLAALLAVAIVTGAIAAWQRSKARHEALQAEVSRLAGLARTLPADQHDLALLLGVQGFEMDPSDETAGGLQSALVQTPPGLDRIIRYRSPTFLPHLDHDGRLLAVAGTDGATVYDLSTGAVKQTMQWPHPREFAVFSGDDSLVAAGGSDGQIPIWDATTGQLSGKPLVVGGGISYALFDPTDNTRIYALTDAGVLTTWDRSDPQHPQQVGAARNFVSVVNGPIAPLETISPDGRLLAGGDAWGSQTSVWDLKTGKELPTLPGAPGVFGANSVTLPIGQGDETILYNARTGRQITAIHTPQEEGSGAFNAPNGWPGAVLSRDGARIAVVHTAARAFDVQVYDVASGQPVGESFHLHGNGTFPVGFLPDGRLVTSGNNEAAIWTPGQNLSPLATLLSVSAALDDYISIFMPAGKDVMTAGQNYGRLLRYDARTGKALGLLLSGKVASPVVPDPVGSLIAATDPITRNVELWELATGKRLAVVTHFARIDWSPDGHRLVTDNGRYLQLSNVADPRHPRLIESIPTAPGASLPDALSYSPDGRSVLTTNSNERRLTVVDMKTRGIRWTRIVYGLRLNQAAISPDGNTIAVNSGDDENGELTLYRSTTGEQINAVPTASDGGVAYLHGGAWLIATSGTSNPGAQLYDARTLQPIGIPFPTTFHVFQSDCCSTKRYVGADRAGTMFSAAAIGDQTVWDANPAHWQTVACQIAGRNLTRAEWHEYLPDRPYRATCPQWPSDQ